MLSLLKEDGAFLNGRHNNEARNRVGKIAVRGICGSYSESLNLLRNDSLIGDTSTFATEGCNTVQSKCIMWLGSSFTNLPPSEAAGFLRNFASKDVLKPTDTLLVGLDRCRDVPKVKAAYSEDLDCWRAYIKNGVANAGSILGGDAINKLDGGSSWEYVARWDATEKKQMV